MQINSVEVRFFTKIPGFQQYSSIEWECRVGAALDDGEDYRAAIQKLSDALRSEAKVHARAARTEQSEYGGGYRG